MIRARIGWQYRRASESGEEFLPLSWFLPDRIKVFVTMTAVCTDRLLFAGLGIEGCQQRSGFVRIGPDIRVEPSIAFA